jgi:hypothetical protein
MGEENHYVARCPFCNVGEADKRGVIEIAPEEATGLKGLVDETIGGRYFPRQYVCGVGQQECSIVKIFDLTNKVNQLASSINNKVLF